MKAGKSKKSFCVLFLLIAFFASYQSYAAFALPGIINCSGSFSHAIFTSGTCTITCTNTIDTVSFVSEQASSSKFACTTRAADLESNHNARVRVTPKKAPVAASGP